MKRNAIITGAGKGVGKTLAIGLAQQGINVGLISQTQSDLDSIEEYINSNFSSKVVTAKADIGSFEQVVHAVNKIKDNLGHVDILINNAATGVNKPVHELQPSEFENVIQTNLIGTFYMTKAVLSDMISQKSGDIINISSTLGERGAPNLSGYCASKFGVMGFTESLRQECLDYGIRVSVISPQSINTRMSVDENTPEEMANRYIQPDDFVSLILAMVNLPKTVNLARASFLNTFPPMVRS